MTLIEYVNGSPKVIKNTPENPQESTQETKIRHAVRSEMLDVFDLVMDQHEAEPEEQEEQEEQEEEEEEGEENGKA